MREGWNERRRTGRGRWRRQVSKRTNDSSKMDGGSSKRKKNEEYEKECKEKKKD